MHAMQNIPTDTVEQSHCAFAQQVLVICDHGIPAALHVNFDQTNVLLQSSSHVTYEQTGGKQVSVLGVEEKRAFTLIVGVSTSGELLPFQVIWQGKTS